MKCRGDLCRRLSVRHQLYNLALAARQRVRLHNQLGDLDGARDLHNHRDLPLCVCAGQPGGVMPLTGTGAAAAPGQSTVGSRAGS